jgi:hypothetical protein
LWYVSTDKSEYKYQYVEKKLLFYGVPLAQLRCAVILASFPFRRETICEILCSGCQEGAKERPIKHEQLI